MTNPNWHCLELEQQMSELLFDPPGLGIPFGATASARSLDSQGRFVELFVMSTQGVVVEAGFLTDGPRASMVLASLWCELAQGLPLTKADTLDELLRAQAALVKLDDHPSLAACLEAGRKVLLLGPKAQEQHTPQWCRNKEPAKLQRSKA